MELTDSTCRMMLHAAYEICGRAHTVAKEMVVCGYQLVPMSLAGDSNASIADMVRQQLDDNNYICGYYQAVSICSCMLLAIYLCPLKPVQRERVPVDAILPPMHPGSYIPTLVQISAIRYCSPKARSYPWTSHCPCMCCAEMRP